MISGPRTLLISPPLWNAYAPHLAVPLLVARMKQRGWSATGMDIGMDHFDRVLSPAGLAGLGDRIERRLQDGVPENERAECERALLVLPEAAGGITAARRALRSTELLFQPDGFFLAKQTIRNALWVVSAAYPRLRFGLAANDLYHSARSTAQVLQAAQDPECNVYKDIFEELLEPRLRDPELGMVGISVSADTQLVAAVTAARICKERRADVRVVMGGNFITRIASRWTEEHPFFSVVDSFVLYEGEDALPMLAERDWSKDPGLVPGLQEPDGRGGLSVQPPRDVDLDGLPVPDYSDLPLDSYFAPGPVLPTYASRSCAWSCAFCAIPFASNRFRQRSAARIVDEMEELSRRHRSRYFMFVDEIMTLRSLGEVTKELQARSSGLFWYGETRFAGGWTSDLAEALYHSGCRRLNLGLESYNQRVLDLMQKGTRVEDIDSNIDLLLSAGVPVHLFAIAGFPGESAGEVNNTISFARQVMRRSVDEYGVPYSTWGMSPFILDLHSPVGQDPARFGVEPKQPPADEDLALSAKYSVREGIDSHSSLVAAARSGVGVVAGGWSGGWFHRAADVANAEEFVFARACNKAPHEARPFEPVAVVSLSPSDTLRLAPTVQWRRSSRRLVSDGEGGTVALYHGTRHLVAELPLPWESALAALKRGVAAEDVLTQLAYLDGVDHRLLSLVRFGFLDRMRAGLSVPLVDLDGHALDTWQVAALPEPDVAVSIDERAGVVMLSQPVSGPQVRLSPIAALAWFHAGQAPSLAVAADKVVAESGVARMEAIGIFRDLVARGVLLLVPANWPTLSGPALATQRFEVST